eukprot:CAMPEP_0116962700 /NCGR_PEP_ID=MMETSP0467-20121206/47438_1 /TAXON_ID=283647 /ORGANISM="Mesodinium pulex, Strain SPMC105" /LENGTH=85 /DNA_ID=CAMNT_0004651121 /DNA_START=966 /DNA_END=1223 /DNA_ORIENTATION=+
MNEIDMKPFNSDYDEPIYFSPVKESQLGNYGNLAFDPNSITNSHSDFLTTTVTHPINNSVLGLNTDNGTGSGSGNGSQVRESFDP